MTDSQTGPTAAQTSPSASTADPESLAKTASTAYDAMLEVIASVEPRVAEAPRAGRRDQNPPTTAYDGMPEVIAWVEPRWAEATRAELRDQRSSLKLIASENYA